MDRFVRSLLSAVPLPPEEELALARRARAGDTAARHALISSGMRSVALRACMLGLRGDDLSDAVQSGAVGLIRAVDRFDPDRGVRLSTYAWRWIGAEMSRPPSREVSLVDADRAVDGDATQRCDLLDVLPPDVAEVLGLRFGIASPAALPLSRQAVGERLGLSISQVRTIEGKAMRQLRQGLAKVVDRAPHQ